MDVNKRKEELEALYTRLCVGIGECHQKIDELNNVINDKLAEARKLTAEYKTLENKDDTNITV